MNWIKMLRKGLALISLAALMMVGFVSCSSPTSGPTTTVTAIDQAAIMALTATSVSSTSVTLNWKGPSSSSLTFKLYKKIGETTTFSSSAIYSGSKNSYTDTGLIPGTTYYYKLVCTVNSTTYESTTVSVTTPALQLSGLNLTATASSTTEITVTWKAHADVSNYVLKRSASDDFSNATTITHNYSSYWSPSEAVSGGFTYTDSSKTPATTYYYKLVCTVSSTQYESSTVSATTQALISGDLRGEWVRMDDGVAYYINKNNQITYGSYGYTLTGVTVARQSDRVLRVTQNSDGKVYYLFGSRLARGNLTGTVANARSTDGVSASWQSAGGLFLSEIGGQGVANASVTLTNSKDSADKITATTDPQGKFVGEDIIPGNTYEVTVGGQTAEVTPNTDGDDIGTITVTGGTGVNFKSSIEPYYSSTDMMNLIANGTKTSFTIKVKNTGTVDCQAAVVYLSLDTGLTYSLSGEYTETNGTIAVVLGTIEPGVTKSRTISVGCDSLAAESALKKIGIRITDTIGKKEWQDSVSLKFNQSPVTFNIRSNGSSIRGVIIAPYLKAYPFSTSSSTSLTLPWSSEDYLVIFSGATAETEAKYSLGINTTASSAWSGFIGNRACFGLSFCVVYMGATSHD